MFLFNSFDVKKEGTDVYFIQYGVYSNYNSMVKNTSYLDNYIYTNDDKYYVYLSFTKDLENLEKLKGYYNDLNYNIYSKVIKVDNEKLIDIIDNYDVILKNVSLESYKYVINDMLIKYKEGLNE